jgi:hypothetical protein
LDGRRSCDFAEINYFSFKGKIRWNKAYGPVGLSTEGPSEVFEIYAQELGSSTNAML